MKKTLALLAAAMLLACSVTACGGTSNTAEETGSTAASANVPANTVHSIDDLEGKTIACQLGTTGYIFAGDIEGATVEGYNKGADAIMALKQGKADAVIIDSEPAKVFVSKNDSLTILDEPFATEEYAIAYKLGNDELGEKIEQALTELKADGTLDEIVSHWVGDEADRASYVPDTSVSRDNGKLVMATMQPSRPMRAAKAVRSSGSTRI